MKLLVVGDVHWSEFCSIVRKQGKYTSMRLENLINSVQWVEHLGKDVGVDHIIYLGDFFDKTIINSEELFALSRVYFSNIPHTIIVGNHEISSADTKKSSAHYFSAMDWCVVDTPCTVNYGNFTAGYLPYITENNRQPLEAYFKTKPDVIFSHNDLKGVQMGQWLSQDGFTADELKKGCYGYIFNGHLHNNTVIDDKIINVGILTGRDFGEDASRYSHLIYILDTDNWKIKPIENPHAFNFYKLDLTNCFKMDANLNPQFIADNLKDNAVLSIKCKQSDKQKLCDIFDSHCIECRYIIEPELEYIEQTTEETLTVDHYAEFRRFCIENMDNTDILKQELDIICKGE